LQHFAQNGNASRLVVPNLGRVRRILMALNVASLPDQMNVPGFRYRQLTGPNNGRYAVDVDGTWQLTFAWQRYDAVDVDLEKL
jgi:proteic killer suppression protein